MSAAVLEQQAQTAKLIGAQVSASADAKPAREPNAVTRDIMALPEASLAALVATKPAYIEAVFSKIEQEHGSVLNFIETDLGVDKTELAILRERYLM